MIRSTLALLAVITGGCAAAPSTSDAAVQPDVMPEADAADIAWVADGVFCEPETVLPLPDRTLLVSNVCDFRQRGNGYLTLLDARGRVLAPRVVDALDAPLGMALRDGRLYVVDANRVRVLRWPGYEPLEIIDIDAQVANDVAVAADRTLYVSDTARGRVVQRNPDGTQAILGAGEFDGANGLALDGDWLYVGGARLWRMHLETSAVEQIGPPWLADIDGIEIEANGTLQVTPVGGPLVRLSKHDKVEILGGAGVSSANHGYSDALGLALIPTGFDNTVIALRLAHFTLGCPAGAGTSEQCQRR